MNVTDEMKRILSKHRRQIEGSPAVDGAARFYALDVIDDIESDLEVALGATTVEPVAWRWRTLHGAPWVLYPKDPGSLTQYPESEVQPLYLAPPAAVPTDAVEGTKLEGFVSARVFHEDGSISAGFSTTAGFGRERPCTIIIHRAAEEPDLRSHANRGVDPSMRTGPTPGSRSSGVKP